MSRVLGDDHYKRMPRVTATGFQTLNLAPPPEFQDISDYHHVTIRNVQDKRIHVHFHFGLRLVRINVSSFHDNIRFSSIDTH